VKINDGWYSERLGREVAVARWGEVGTPFLIYPTAGGDAEEIERFLVIDTLAPYLEAGLIKVYSCDSIAGRAMLAGEGSPQHQMALLDRFIDFVGRELVPAIHADCGTDDLPMIVGGSSIGAFNALATLSRFPTVFRSALCMSGTYDLERFLEAPPTPDFLRASPVHYLSHLEGPRLDALRSCFVLLASGEGEQEDIGESWRVASLLGSRGIPNRVDSWGAEWKHDWPTWRNMLHRYTPDLVAGLDASGAPGDAPRPEPTAESAEDPV
jgi:esterase/lipase superfamily enzyme